jgi:hypothetical protein
MVLPFLIPVAASIASDLLPTLIGKLGGNRAEEIAEKVVKTAAAAAGVPGSTNAEEIKQKLRENPDALAVAQLELQKLDFEEYQKILDDRENARQRDTKFTEHGRINWRANLMLMIAFLGIIVCLMLVSLSQQLKPEVVGLFSTVIGVLLKALSDAFAFEFGSSQGSKAKDRQIDQIQAALFRVAKERGEAMRTQTEIQAKTLVEVAATKTQAAEGSAKLPFVDRLVQGKL